MSQIFPRSANAIARFTLVGVLLFGGLVASIVGMSMRSDLVTGAGDVGDQVYMVQAFLAGLQIVSLALAVSVSERERLRDELGSTDAELDGSVERLDDARRRIAQLNAELAGRRAELVQAERRSDRVASELRESEAARRRSERELGHKLTEADKARLPLGYLL